MIPRLMMDKSPDAQRTFLQWLKPDLGPMEVLGLLFVLIVGGLSMSFRAFAGVGGFWLGTGLGILQFTWAFWIGVRWAERRSRRVTRDCGIFMDRVNDLLRGMAQDRVIVPGPGALINHDVSGVEH